MRRHPAGLLLADQPGLAEGTICICSGSCDDRSEVLNSSCIDMIERQVREFSIRMQPAASDIAHLTPPRGEGGMNLLHNWPLGPHSNIAFCNPSPIAYRKFRQPPKAKYTTNASHLGSKSFTKS